MRGEVGVKKETNKEDVTKVATIENAKKCLDNAMRLYEDSKKVTTPTRLALVEIAVEELAKGMILFLKYEPKGDLDALENLFGANILNELEASNNDDMVEAIFNFKQSDFNTKNHKHKLKAIQKLLDISKQYYVPLIKILGLMDLEKLYAGLEIENFKIPREGPTYYKDINVQDMDEIKMSGLYVNFKDGKSISPEEANYANSDKLYQVLVGFGLVLRLSLELVKGTFDITKFRDPKTLLGPFYELIHQANQNKAGKKSV